VNSHNTSERNIVKVPVTPFMAHWMCIKCMSGEMKSAGHGGSNNIEHWWWHKCNKCGYEDIAPDVYPRIVHEEIK